MSDMFGHHSVYNNFEKSFYNLLLYTDHLSGANSSCGNCLAKHISDVIAYTDEGRTLDEGEKFLDLSEETIDLMNKHLRIVLACTVGDKCEIKSPHDIMKMVREARALRRKIGIAIYGVDSDVASDDEDDHDFTHKGKKHSHDHEHGHIHFEDEGEHGHIHEDEEYKLTEEDPLIKQWKERKENYIKGLHGAHGGIVAYKKRLGAYIASLSLGREFGEKVDAYFRRKGYTKFVDWADKELDIHVKGPAQSEDDDELPDPEDLDDEEAHYHEEHDAPHE